MFASLGIIALAICYNAYGQNTASPTGNSTSTGNTTSPSSSVLSFGPVNFAGYNNYVYRDEIISAQVLLSE